MPRHKQAKKSPDLDADTLRSILNYLTIDINRYRDWPIRILTFTSAIYFGLIGILLLKRKQFNLIGKIVASTLVVALFIWTFHIFYHCHRRYMEHRKIQAGIQGELGLQNLAGILSEYWYNPSKWFEGKEPSRSDLWDARFFRWGFYVFYAFGLSVFSIALILGLVGFCR